MGYSTATVARAAAAYLTRSRFGYPAGETPKPLGDAGPSSVTRAVRCVEERLGRLSGQLANIGEACANHKSSSDNKCLWGMRPHASETRRHR